MSLPKKPDTFTKNRRQFIKQMGLGSGLIFSMGLVGCSDSVTGPEEERTFQRNVLDWGASNTYDPTQGGGQGSAAAFQRAIDEIFETEDATELHIPDGSYLIETALDLKDRNLTLVGAGPTHTKLYMGEQAGTVFDIFEQEDTYNSPCFIESLTLSGTGRKTSSKTTSIDALVENINDTPLTVGMGMARRHFFEIEALHVRNFDVGIRAYWTWLCRWENILFTDSRIGLLLEGWTNRCKMDSLSFQGKTMEVGIYIGKKNPNQENNSIVIDTCDFEFLGQGGVGTGVVNDSNRTVLMRNCYSEQVSGPVVRAVSGLTHIQNGFFNYNLTGANPLVHLDGGNVIVEKADLYAHYAQPHPLSQLVQGTDGSVVFRECNYGALSSGLGLFEGDVFGYGAGKNLVPSLGRSWAVQGITGRAEKEIVDQNAVRATWTANGLVSVHAGLDASYRRGEPLYLLVVYDSTVACDVKLSGGVGAALPNRLLVQLPATGEAVKTAIKLDARWGNEDFSLVEFIAQGGVGDAFTLREVTLVDGRLMRAGGKPDGLPSNLYKVA